MVQKEGGQRILLIQIQALRDGKLTGQVAEIVVSKIKLALEVGEATFKDLGITEAELDSFLVTQVPVSEKELPVSYLITQFLNAWHRYQQGKLTLAGLQPSFAVVQKLIADKKVTPHDLMPFQPGDFFQLKTAFEQPKKGVISPH